MALRDRRHIGVVLVALSAIVAAVLLWRALSLSPTAMATLRAQLPGLIQSDMNLLDLPADAAAQRQALDADGRGALRESVLHVWDTEAADARVKDLASSRQLMVRNHLVVYDGVRVNVVSWDDIIGSGTTARVRVTLLASVHRSATGIWEQPKRDQWEFGLRKQNNDTWRITSERVTAYLSGQG